MAYNSIEEIINKCIDNKISFYEVIMQDTCIATEKTEEENIARMRNMWQVMCEASEKYNVNLKSRSGMVGGTGRLMELYMKSGVGYCGEFILTVIFIKL